MFLFLIKALSKLHPYKDFTDIPNEGNITNFQGGMYLLAMYSIAIIIFMVSFISYTQLDSLKEEITSIQTEHGMH